MHVPQIVFLILMIISTVVKIMKHGEPRDNYNAFEALLDAMLTVLLLWWGGFWS